MNDLCAGLASSSSDGKAAVALALDGVVVASASCGVGRRASEELLPTLNRLLQESGLGPSDLTRVAVTRGPGSFTGIRVGLSCAFGLARAVEAELEAASSLELMARRGAPAASTALSVVPAGRRQVYAGIFRHSSDGSLKSAGEPLLTTLDELLTRFGDAVFVLEEGLGIGKGKISAQCIVVSALDLARDIATTTGTVSFDVPEPLYIRRSWAEEVRLGDGRNQ